MIEDDHSLFLFFTIDVSAKSLILVAFEDVAYNLFDSLIVLLLQDMLYEREGNIDKRIIALLRNLLV